MTLEEAQKVGNIIATADGGCSTCIEKLCEVANEVFPEFIFECEMIVDPIDFIVKVSKK